MLLLLVFSLDSMEGVIEGEYLPPTSQSTRRVVSPDILISLIVPLPNLIADESISEIELRPPSIDR